MFKQKQNELKEKYKKEIEGISKHNNVDLKVAFIMLTQNPNRINDGLPAYEGAEINYDELRKDLAELDTYRR